MSPLDFLKELVTTGVEAAALYEAGDALGAGKLVAEFGLCFIPADQLKAYLDPWAIKAANAAADLEERAKGLT
jgi:hypothetical protein